MERRRLLFCGELTFEQVGASLLLGLTKGKYFMHMRVLVRKKSRLHSQGAKISRRNSS